MPTIEAAELKPLLRGVTHAYAFWVALVAAGVLTVLVHGGLPRLSALVYGTRTLRAVRRLGDVSPLALEPAVAAAAARRIDHSTIFVFIAASYTPVALLVMHGYAALGHPRRRLDRRAGRRHPQRRLDHRAARAQRRRLPRAGWVAIAAMPQLISRLPVAPLALLAAGGILYSTGAVVYAAKRPNPWPRIFGFHEIFHALVIAAAVTHFVAMAGWIFPQGA